MPTSAAVVIASLVRRLTSERRSKHPSQPSTPRNSALGPSRRAAALSRIRRAPSKAGQRQLGLDQLSRFGRSKRRAVALHFGWRLLQASSARRVGTEYRKAYSRRSRPEGIAPDSPARPDFPLPTSMRKMPITFRVTKWAYRGHHRTGPSAMAP
jgi:hypothetical protein